MWFRSKRARVLTALVVVILVGIFLPPYVTANRLRPRVAAAISNALGRKTTIGNITLRLLPQPGFDFENFVVEDDPAFSAEPMIRADEVTAYLRLSALWQGRFEVAQLSLSNPSLNLVRNAQGEWNIEALLARATQVPAAPTTKRSPESRPRFPYIQANDGRINLKFGQEKKPYALSEADFALWLASENEWRMRLEARPIRTDANLSDTGTVKVEGSLVRAAMLRDTTLRFDYDWEKAQLGNLSQMIWGRDRGWRGTLDVSGSLAGTPRELLLSARAGVSEFRRYDIIASDPLNAEVRCSARLLGDTQTLSDLDCHLPMGNGEIAVRGMVTGLLNDRRWETSVTAAALPMPELARFARHVKKDMAPDLSATGTLDAALSYRTLNGVTTWSGGGGTTPVRVSGRGLDRPLEIGAVKFVLAAIPSPVTTLRRVARPQAPAPQPQLVPARLTLQPFTVELGGPAPASIEGTVDRQAYYLKAGGDADVQRVVAVAVALGLRPPPIGARGDIHLQVALSGGWDGFQPPALTGNAQLRNVSAELKGINSTIQVASALLAFSDDGVDALNTSASFTGSSVALQGDFHVPRGCNTLLDCPVRFELTSPALNLDDLNRLLNPRFHAQPWYHFLVGSQQTTGIRRLRAEGTLATPRLVVKAMVVNHVTAALRFEGGKLVIHDLNGDLFGGKHHGDWVADFSGNTPVYSGEGTIDKTDLAQLATTMRDNWGAGLVAGRYKFSASGDTAEEIAASARGELQFDWRNGLLRHVALHGAAPLRVKRFTGTLALHDARLSFDAGKMETPDGIYMVSGSSTFARAIDFKLTGPTHSFTVTGTLDRPRVAAPPPTEAVLKP